MYDLVIKKLLITPLSLYLSISCLTYFVLCLPNRVWAHAISVHQGLTDTSFTVPIPNSAFYSSRHANSGADARQGSADEDAGTRPLGHFYNPVTGRAPSFGTRGPATDNAEAAWREALSRYCAGEFMGINGAFHSLGRVLHLMQDMTSPAHVHDDAHLTVLGIGGDDFENWGHDNFANYNFAGVQLKFEANSWFPCPTIYNRWSDWI